MTVPRESGGLTGWITRPDPLAFEYRPVTLEPRGHEGADSATCVHNGGLCQMASTWRYLLGCPSEHIARLSLCDGHAMHFDHYAGRIGCTSCGEKMRIEIREKM